MTSLRVHLSAALRALALAGIGYTALAFLAYSFRHPELTQTQVLLHWWEAVTWQ